MEKQNYHNQSKKKLYPLYSFLSLAIVLGVIFLVNRDRSPKIPPIFELSSFSTVAQNEAVSTGPTKLTGPAGDVRLAINITAIEEGAVLSVKIRQFYKGKFVSESGAELKDVGKHEIGIGHNGMGIDTVVEADLNAKGRVEYASQFLQVAQRADYQ